MCCERIFKQFRKFTCDRSRQSETEQRVDQDGRIWTSSAQGVLCHRPDGHLVGRVRVPEMVSNVCFGGARRNRLFICGTTSLYAIYLKING